MVHQTIDIEQECDALQQFFQKLGDNAVIVQLRGKPLGIVYPAADRYWKPRGRLEDAAGGWDSLPDEITRAIEEGR